MVARGEGSRRLVEKGKELRSTDWSLQYSHGYVNYSIGNIISNIVVTMYGAKWVLEILGGTLCKVYDCLTIRLCTPINKVVVHIYNGTLLGHIKKQNPTVCDSMDGLTG